MLSRDFDVVGVATCGNRALEKAREVEPDVIVLDIEMPGLDGFDTCRALKQDGLATPVVFLSTYDRDEVVRAAFGCGGHGYVQKSRVADDLVSALDQAVVGRRFVPSLISLLDLADGGLHAMHLHDDMETLLDGLGDFFDASLRRGDVACVIATRPVRDGLGDGLRARGWDVGGSSGHKRYLVVDAADALNRFMRNGLPDPDRLCDIATELDQYRRAVAGHPTARLTIFGNMVVSLIEEGNAPAAIALEHRWNTLTQGLPFLTLCGYAGSCFHDGVPDLWPDACAEHAVLSHAADVYA
jgi:CheY-like chemotaxis protein